MANTTAAAAMTKETAVRKLLAAHSAWYDVREGFQFAGRTFRGYAEFHSYGEKYVLVKRAKLWEVGAHDYLFIDAVERLDLAKLEDYVSFMTTDALALPQPKPDHMQSSLSLIVVADGIDDDARKAAKKAKFRKTYKHGIWGWSDLRLAVVDLSDASVVTNAAGKDLRASIEANVTAPASGAEKA